MLARPLSFSNKIAYLGFQRITCHFWYKQQQAASSNQQQAAASSSKQQQASKQQAASSKQQSKQQAASSKPASQQASKPAARSKKQAAASSQQPAASSEQAAGSRQQGAGRKSEFRVAGAAQDATSAERCDLTHLPSIFSLTCNPGLRNCPASFQALLVGMCGDRGKKSHCWGIVGVSLGYR